MSTMGWSGSATLVSAWGLSNCVSGAAGGALVVSMTSLSSLLKASFWPSILVEPLNGGRLGI